VLIPFHTGTVVFSSLLVLPFEIIVQLVLRFFPSAIAFLPYFTATTLVQSSFNNKSLIEAAGEVASLAKKAPGLIRSIFAVNCAFVLLHSTVAAVCTLFAWPSLIRMADKDATITSVAEPLTIIFALSILVSRTVSSVLSAAAESTLLSCAADVVGGKKGPVRFPRGVVEAIESGGLVAAEPDTDGEEEDVEAPAVELAGDETDKKKRLSQAKQESENLLEKAGAAASAAEDQMEELMKKFGMEVPPAEGDEEADKDK